MNKKTLITLNILLSSLLAFKYTVAQEVPVLVNTISSAKALFIIDDSGSMEAIMEHPDFNPTAAAVTNTSNDIPSVIFRLESGASAASTSHTLRPVLVEYNYLFNNLFTSSRGQVTGNLFEAKSLSNATTMDLIEQMGCTTSSNYCTAPSDSNQWGYHNAVLYGNSSVRGTSVFATSRLVGTDTSGNEYLRMNYYSNLFYQNAYDWSGYWPKFDTSGNMQTVTGRVFMTRGGNVVFNGKQVFLSAGFYRIEYLRWIFYVANSTQLANLPGVTRIELIQDVMEDLILNNPEVDFGLASLNGTQLSAGVFSGYLNDQFFAALGNETTGTAPKIRAPIGTSDTSLISTLHTLAPAGGTPLANTYIEAMRYFAGQTDRDPYCSSCTYTSPIDSACDSHFIILLTDGLPSSETSNKYGNNYITDYDGDNEDGASTNENCSDSVCANFLDDAAGLAYDTDFSSSLSGTQNLTSFAVGLGLDFDLLDDFAENGGSGSSLRADTATEISDSLQDIITMIINTPVSGAGAALAETFGEGGLVYRPRFRADTWNGNIDVFRYDQEDDQLNFQYDMGTILEERNIDTSPRTIIAGYDPDHDGNTNSTIDFTTTNAANLRPELFQFYISGAISSSLLSDEITDYTADESANKLIRYIHGEEFEEMRSRDRDNDGDIEKLGDIVYSRPVEVGPKNGTYNRMTGYTDFVAGRNSQPRLLLVGANDGAIHAFNSSTGEEVWAYIPSSQLPYLETLARKSYNRQYRRSFVDGYISVEDVYVNSQWRTYAMFGLRNGGSSYVILDITDREDPQLVYEINAQTSGGKSWSKPTVVLHNGGSTSNSPSSFTWYMAVGTGEGKTTAGTNLLFYPLNSATPPAPIVLPISASDPAGTRTSNLTVTQNDRDLNVDRIYVGTEEGDMFRVHVGLTAPSAWTVEKLYNGTSAYPIVSAPTAVLLENPNATATYAIGLYWGTGRYDERVDITGVGATAQRIFGIFDPVQLTGDDYSSTLVNLTTSNLQNQSISTFNVRKDNDGIYRIPTNKNGFFINTSTTITVTTGNFINPVGMTFYEPANVRGALLFATFLPNQSQCEIGGHGFFQAVNYRTGGGMIVDYSTDPAAPFFNGGIPDFDSDNDRDEEDLEGGFDSGKLQAVVDAYINSVTANETIPYEHDGLLSIDDVRLHSTNGGILPSVSSLGLQGAPVSPSALLGAQRIVIQSAYPVPPGTGSGAGSGGSGDGAGDSEGEDSEEVPPPNLIPINTYNIPVSMLSFKESSGE